MRYWWVNQNQTYRAETRGSFMWSPKQNANGARNQFYENMRHVSAGDIVFSVCDTRILAIGVVTLSQKRLQEKEGRLLKLVSGAIMVLLGIYLILMPR